MKSLLFMGSLLFVVFACTSAPHVHSDYVDDRHRFLKLLFEQTTDQDFQSNKWNEACLKDNQVGEVQENQKVKWFTSALWMNEKNLPGFCPGQSNVHKTGIVYFSCKHTGFNSQVKCAEVSCSDFIPERVCLN